MHMKWWGWGSEDKSPDTSNMPKFLPYVRQLLGCDTSYQMLPIAFDDINLNPIIENKPFLHYLTTHFDAEQLQQDKYSRLLHAYGKSYRDLARIRKGEVLRAPDLIVYPQNHSDVSILMDAAIQFDACLIAFGGGTNIVGALEAPASEARMVVSVDMSHMNKVLTIDASSQTATIQAGAFGPEIESQLNEQGFSLGHFPDSFEFSTLGGWLATRSVGMQSDQYGTIADMTLALTCVTPAGSISLVPYPHASMGPNLNEIIIGSEGRFGIITEAVMKIHPIPAAQHFSAIIFPNFLAGLSAIKECSDKQELPHMMRLLDPDETQLSFHFKPLKSRLEQSIEAAIKKAISTFRKIDFSQCCVAIIAFSGTSASIKRHKKNVLGTCKKHGAVNLGKTPGKQWYARKYDYPYLRDLIMNFGCIVDVAETSVLWSNVEPIYDAIKKAGYEAMSQCIPHHTLATLKKPGYLGCHLSHHYQNGTCLYFTFAFLPQTGYENGQYNWVKSAITDTIVKHKGSLSHHHGIGYEHAKWLPDVLGETGMTLLNKIKTAIDPGANLNPKDITQMPTDDIGTKEKSAVF